MTRDPIADIRRKHTQWLVAKWIRVGGVTADMIRDIGTLLAHIERANAAVDGVNLVEGHIRDNATPDQLREMLLGAGLEIERLKTELARSRWIVSSPLRRANDEFHAIEQTLGKALGYPWLKDDQKNFPGATEADGVCVGEHVAATLAGEAALRIDRLREALTWAVGFIDCQMPKTKERYPDMRNAMALVEGSNLCHGEFQMAMIRAECAEDDNAKLKDALAKLQEESKGWTSETKAAFYRQADLFGTLQQQHRELEADYAKARQRIVELEKDGEPGKWEVKG